MLAPGYSTAIETGILLMLRSCLRLIVVLGLVLLTPHPGHTQPEPNGRPTRPPGWEYRPSPGNEAPAFAFDPCPGCGYHDSAYVAIRCESGKAPAMTLNPNDQGGRLTRLEGQQVVMELVIDGVRYGFRMLVEVGPTGPIMETTVPSEHPMFQTLADGNRAVLNGPGGALSMPLRGSDAAIRRWADACNAQVAAPPPPAPPAGGIASLGPTPPGKGEAAMAPPAPVAATPVVPEVALRARVDAFLARHYDGIRRSGYTIRLVDLNDDGSPEALVEFVFESGQCGAANCPLEILDLSGPSPRQMFDGVAIEANPRPLNSRTGGWRDIRLADGSTLRWGGGRYHR